MNKKLLILTICIVFLLASCTSNETVPPSETVTQNVSAQEKEEIIVTDTSVTITTLDRWYEFNNTLDGAHQFSSQCYDILRMIIRGESDFEEFKTVELGDWEIVRDTEKYADNDLSFNFTVISSSLDTLPKGSYTAIFHDREICTLDFVKNDPRKEDFTPQSEASKIVTDWIESTNSWSMPEFGKAVSGTQDVCADYIIHRYGENGRILVSEFKKILTDKFGITAVESEIKSVIADSRRYIETRPANQTCYAQFSIIGEKESGDTTTVTVQFYADSSRFIKTDVVEYYIDKNERLLGSKRISIGSYDPFELYNIFD